MSQEFLSDWTNLIEEQVCQECTYEIKSLKNEPMESANSDTLPILAFKYQSRRLFPDPSKRSWRVILNGFAALSAFISDWGDRRALLPQKQSLEGTWRENAAAEIFMSHYLESQDRKPVGQR